MLHELTAQRSSLEQAFMQITGQDVEFHAGAVPSPALAGAMEGAQQP